MSDRICIDLFGREEESSACSGDTGRRLLTAALRQGKSIGVFSFFFLISSPSSSGAHARRKVGPIAFSMPGDARFITTTDFITTNDQGHQNITKNVKGGRSQRNPPAVARDLKPPPPRGHTRIWGSRCIRTRSKLGRFIDFHSEETQPSAPTAHFKRRLQFKSFCNRSPSMKNSRHDCFKLRVMDLPPNLRYYFQIILFHFVEILFACCALLLQENPQQKVSEAKRSIVTW